MYTCPACQSENNEDTKLGDMGKLIWYRCRYCGMDFSYEVLHGSRTISAIAREINRSWENPYFGAVPYLNAMFSLDSIDQMYGMDRADSIVRYFLSNAATWKGETARRIKKELKALVS
jgi:hypothetical protein